MALPRAWTAAHGRWRLLTLYQKFEQAIVTILTLLIAVVIVSAVWNLILKIFYGLVVSPAFDPTDHVVFQTVFGMIFTVIIALESSARCWWPRPPHGHRAGADGDLARHAGDRPQAHHPRPAQQHPTYGRLKVTDAFPPAGGQEVARARGRVRRANH